MKKFFSICLLLLAFFTGNAQYEKAELQASGLTCSMCSNAIYKALKTLPFVETVNTDLNKNLFTMVFKKNSNPDFDLIKSKVDGAGFSVAKFWVWINTPEMQVTAEEHLSLYGINLHFMNIKSQSVNGEFRLQIIDKGYLPDKDFRKFSAYTSMPCYKSGYAGSCCKSAHGQLASGTRMYHVTI